MIGSSNAANVEAAVARLGEGASGKVVNANDEASVAAFFERLGAFNHLVFTAGDWGPSLFSGPVVKMDFGSAGDALKVRFWGALMAIKRAHSRILPNGSITLTDGALAHRPRKGAPLVTAFGGALEHLARGLAVDLAPFGSTQFAQAWYSPKVLRIPGTCPSVHRAAVDSARRRAGRGGAAYLYLMRGTYTTGQVMIVDGGLTLT